MVAEAKCETFLVTMFSLTDKKKDISLSVSLHNFEGELTIYIFMKGTLNNLRRIYSRADLQILSINVQ